MTSRVDHQRPQYPDLTGHFKRAYHLEMVADRARTEAIFDALRRTLFPDAVFCELGCGTGLFSVFAAAHCKQVYAVELDDTMVGIARENIARSRHAHRIQLVHSDARQAELPEPADIAFCEMMSIWTIEEPQVPVANDARARLLKPGGVFLPLRIVNLVELGHQNFRVRDIVMKAAMPLFTGITRPAVMTERRVCKELDFSKPVDMDLSVDLELTALAAGLLNCAILSSIVQMGPDVVFAGSDSLMPPTVVPLAEEVTVKAGDRLRFRASARARSDMGDAVFLCDVG